MHIALGADHAGFHLKESLQRLAANVHRNPLAGERHGIRVQKIHAIER